MTTIKTVARRDSATTILRKLGVKPRDYNLFIEVTADDQFAVKVGAAEKHLKDLAGPSPKEQAEKIEQAAKVEHLRTKLVRKVKSEQNDLASKASFRAAQVVVNAVTEAPNDGESCASYARHLIKAGHSNAEIWVALVEHFKLNDAKRGYPAWYRHQMRKTGVAI